MEGEREREWERRRYGERRSALKVHLIMIRGASDKPLPVIRIFTGNKTSISFINIWFNHWLVSFHKIEWLKLLS